PRLLNRRVGVHREIGRHLQADITISAVRLVVDGTQRVGRVLDVPDRQLFVDRRIGRDAGQPILFNELLEPALGDKTSGEKVEPDNLPEVIQLLEWVHGRFVFDLDSHTILPLNFAIRSLAAATTWAGVKPNLVRRSLSGAEAPNVRMPIFAPTVPA